jgi:drug/metabolite transporter (DMT)-like permease
MSASDRESKVKMPMRGVVYALLASVLFGLSTPISKSLLGRIDPLLLAGLFYLGSGVGLITSRFALGKIQPDLLQQRGLHKREWIFLGPAIVAGGIIAPALLMYGLLSSPASTASLLMNMEGVFTALIAWFIFKENFDQRILLGMIAMVFGGAVLSLHPGQQFLPTMGSLLIIGACLGWALDNNLTRKVSNADATLVAAYKGLVAGTVNTLLALFMGARLPSLFEGAVALTVGLLSYGASLVLYVLGLRHIGAARTGAYFAVAPFIGATVSLIVLNDALTPQLIGAGLLMGLGLWLHLTEHHSHKHIHVAIEHEHEHIHDEHHQHEHTSSDPPGEPHVHAHRHENVEHEHPHFPDEHHLHPH